MPSDNPDTRPKSSGEKAFAFLRTWKAREAECLQAHERGDDAAMELTVMFMRDLRRERDEILEAGE